MSGSIRAVILAGIVIAVAWLGHRFITSSEQATEGTGNVSELAVLPESANEKARTAAAACDEGDGEACGRLWGWYEGGIHGLSADRHAYRRLCRKACEGGDDEACTRWQNGDDQCPMGST